MIIAIISLIILIIAIISLISPIIMIIPIIPIMRLCLSPGRVDCVIVRIGRHGLTPPVQSVQSVHI